MILSLSGVNGVGLMIERYQYDLSESASEHCHSRKLIRNFRPRAGRVVMVFAEKEAIQSQWRQNVGQSCSIDG